MLLFVHPNHVTSGVPQGSVLGPTLFIYYINDLPDVVDCFIKIFADDTKLYLPIVSYESSIELQRNIDNLVKWTDDWQIKFNSSKCKVLHIGSKNPGNEYTMNGNVLDVTTAERDLGVVVDPELSFNRHIMESIKKCNRVSGMIVGNIECKCPEVMVPLFKSLVRPVIEYGNAVYNTTLIKHSEEIENVQRRFTKKIIGMRNLDYEQRLQKLKLPSLEYRRIRGDLIELFKMTHNFYDPITTNSLF